MANMIYQVKVGPNPPAFYNICIASVSAYCKKYGIDHVVQTDPILRIRPLKSARSKQAVERLGYLPIFEKEVAFNYLDDYEQICIIDSDIYVRDTAPNLFDELNTDTVFAGVIERDMPLTNQYQQKVARYSQGQYGPLKDVNWDVKPGRGAEYFNMGLMLFSNQIKPYLNGQTPKQFIRRPEFERFVNGEGQWRWSTDQTLLNYWVRKSGMKCQHLSWKWNALFKGIKDDKLPQAHFIHFFLAAVLPEKGKEIPRIINNLGAAKHIKGHG